jgi:hypothetical protein
MVGLAHGLLVVLDDDDRVAEVAQLLERGEQAAVVALVQADRRLVEDVEHAHEARADLRGEPDALRLAAGQRLRRPVEREVVEANVARKRSRSRTSLRIGPAMSASRPGAPLARSVIAAKKSSACAIDSSTICPTLRSCTVTASDSGLRRVPPHDVHGLATMYESSS